MTGSRIGIAVIGANIGRAQAAAFRSLADAFDLRVICDREPERARDAAAEFGCAAATDFTAVCARPDVAAISLCTPPPTHYALIAEALAAGKEVICEKPLVGSLREVDELAALERGSKGRIMPIFQNRFGGGLQKLRRLVQAGATGRLLHATVETAWNRGDAYYATEWRGSWEGSLGGCLLQQGIHAHDAYTYIAGPVRRVAAFATTRVNPIETEDCAAIAVEAADGSLATFSVTLGAAEESTRHRFYFERLTAESNSSAYANTSDPWTFTPRAQGAGAEIASVLAGLTPSLEGYAGQFLRYADSLRRGRALPVSLADGRAALELTTALYGSLQRELPMTLPISSADPLYAGWAPLQCSGRTVRA